MPRAIWTGSISFGLVNVPVKVYAAVHDHEVHFNQLEKSTGARVRYEKVSEGSGHPLKADEIELGYPVGRGQYVVVDRDELDELRPTTTSTIEVSDFVDLSSIDPVYFAHTYWLAPAGQGAERAYRLLAAASEKAQRVGIGTVVMRNKQYLAAIRPFDGVLAMSTMRFVDEVVAPAGIDGLTPTRTKPDAKELSLATQIIASLSGDWDPKRYHDTYTEELRDLLDRKAKGEVVEPEATAEEQPGKVLDLMEALEASVNEAKKRDGQPSRRGRPGASAASGPASAARSRRGARSKSPSAKEPAPKRSGAKGSARSAKARRSA
jgi:DNA end-binding protein Ku